MMDFLVFAGYYQPAGPLITATPLHGGFKDGGGPPSLQADQASQFGRYPYPPPQQVSIFVVFHSEQLKFDSIFRWFITEVDSVVNTLRSPTMELAKCVTELVELRVQDRWFRPRLATGHRRPIGVAPCTDIRVLRDPALCLPRGLTIIQ
jgi:hypothetical protein